MSSVILIVEDEGAIRELVVRLARRAGYQTLEAGSAETALRIVQESEPPQLMLTDIVLPGMSGLVLAAQIHKLRPSLPVIFMTGFADQYQGELSGSVCLRKPFSASELINAIQDVIGPPRAAEETSRSGTV